MGLERKQSETKGGNHVPACLGGHAPFQHLHTDEGNMPPFKADARNHREKSARHIEIVQHEPFGAWNGRVPMGLPSLRGLSLAGKAKSYWSQS